MNKFGLYSGNNNTIPFDSHIEGLKDETRNLLISLRKKVQALGDNVIEEVRPHRIVYAKSLTFRYFLDIQPSTDKLVISIKKNRTELAKEYVIKHIEELEEIEPEIKDAYLKI